MNSLTIILREYRCANKKKRDEIWLKYRSLRHEFDEIEAQELADALDVKKKKDKVDKKIKLLIQERPSALLTLYKGFRAGKHKVRIGEKRAVIDSNQRFDLYCGGNNRPCISGKISAIERRIT